MNSSNNGTPKMIKIKLGDTLKRMKLSFYDGRLELTMIDLRKKICDLFKFPADADFILTYVDEDGDVVTLFDDDDLSDAVDQCLKFVKIDVQLSNNNAQSGGSSISTQRLTSLQTQHPYPKIGTFVVAKVSKSKLQWLRDLLHKALKIYEYIISTVSAPGLVDLISKAAQTYLKYLDSLTHSGGSSISKSMLQRDLLHKALSTIYEYISKAAPAPVLLLVDFISKTVQTYLNWIHKLFLVEAGW
ncbi:hypothetical protein I3760_11G018600 [Carya illinoinensis]|nr:hypothetical protein I3760_11G018600 [Carya illinoinensis]KAG2678764.1 hypothetical protein I3760_11G018600 [Carya illinoinensis]